MQFRERFIGRVELRAVAVHKRYEQPQPLVEPCESMAVGQRHYEVGSHP